MKTIFLFSASCLFLCATAGGLRAGDPPVALDSAVILDPHSKDGAKSDVRFWGQSAKGGVIDLTAANGFFDRCFEALEGGESIDGEKRFIGPSFGYLKRFSDKVPGTARWHLWVAKPGEIQATFFLTVPKTEAGHPWTIRMGEETQTLKAVESDGESAQKQTLTFKVAKPGQVVFVIDCTKSSPPAETRIHRIRLDGFAVAKASLLRMRWRPSAVHARFHAPPECPAPNMWVFETRSVSNTSSYSPLTTGFGYYGTAFNAEGNIAAGAGFNFSMWAAGRGATVAPPLHRMPRLIGTDIAHAKYSTFGSEGSGVRFGGAVAYPEGAERTIQALRIEPTPDGLLTYFGYFYDEKAGCWKLYASAQKPPKNAKAAENPGFGTMRSTGSFCEVPGPPNRQRSGDLVREIKRRGWFYGKDGKWYRAVLGDALKDQPPDPTEPDNDGPITNHRVYYMDDYPLEGWISMSTGGVAYHLPSAHNRKPPEPMEAPPLPAYLAPDKAKQLFALPVEFGKSEAQEIHADKVTVEYTLNKVGLNAKAILYYGTVDCLTYPQKKVTKGSAVEIDMARPERTWQFATPEMKVAEGANRFRLADLKSKTTYHYRLFVTHDEGKSWDYQSGRFTTKNR